MESLTRYRQMRDFAATNEPQGGSGGGVALRYGVQMHDATRLHWDLRLEWRDKLLSWAVTRGPSTDPADKRLAVRTEDHPMDYLTFEGTIPKGNYGAGTVMLWDIGWWQPFHDVDDGLAQGHLHFALHGRRATGGWSLVRMKGARTPNRESAENWLMVKDRDAAAKSGKAAFTEIHPTSVVTGRNFEAIVADASAKPFGPVRRKAAPGFVAVQLAQAASAPPADEDWLHELKLDGYRAQVAIGKGGVRIRTRNGHDWTNRFAELVPPLAELPCGSALIDGEIVVGAGLQGFSTLQAAIKARGPFQFHAFDLLALDGKDLASRPLTHRRTLLERLMVDVVPLGMLRVTSVIDAPAAELLARICSAGGEGLISKRKDAPYRSGSNPTWVKSKCVRRAEFIIVGWQPSSSRGRPFASLLMATIEDGAMTYRGKVGTGFDDQTIEYIAEVMRPLRTKLPSFDPPADAKGAVWVEPHLIAEIAHAEMTDAGHLRHGRFIALREDKYPSQVALDRPPAMGPTGEPLCSGERTKIAGIGISNSRRLIFPQAKVTKIDLARYYEAMANRILPTLAARPISLLRLPEGINGERFFQKHAGQGFPRSIRRVLVAATNGAKDEWLTIDDAAGLVAAVQMGTVEFHPWGAGLDNPERPERLVFDLDPDESLSFDSVRAAAFAVRDRLANIGLASWGMLSGGKGVHVIVPLRRTVSWETAKLFTQLFATLMANAEPDLYVATMSKRARKGRIFIDWLRNERGATAIAPFSVRARPRATVAVPVDWDELARIKRADAFSMKAALQRGWGDLDVPHASSLDDKVMKALEA